MRRSLPLVLTFVLLAGACSDDSASTAAPGTTAPGATAPAATTDVRPSGAPADTDASAPTAGSDGVTFPGASWDSVDPTAVGLSTSGVDALAALGAASGSGCIAVVRDGRLAVEWYADDWDAATDLENFSATKSVSATLVGIAQDLGYLDIEQPASDFLTEWQGTDSEAVTIRNLISNDSGRFWDFETDYQKMVFSPDRSAFAIGLEQQHEPGTHWEYNNSAIQTLEQVLQRATGEEVADFAEEHLFGPLGMTVHYKLDPSGNTRRSWASRPGASTWPASGGSPATRDDGATGRSCPPTTWPRRPASQELNDGYGFLWWVNEHDAWPGIPTDAYAALGLGDQITLVIPSLDMVVVRVGPTAGTADYEGSFLVDLGTTAIAALDG
ncbi:MAG: serine hydrolase domain-containing protein [Acidimicrobiales bacterium]